jgi:ketosteroid isomerase-like protein
MAAQIATTEAVFAHHLQEIFARSVDGIMLDYVEESVVFAPQGIFKGLEQIRAFFTAAMPTVLTPDVLAAIKIQSQAIDGEFAYVLWSALPKILVGSDTFCIRDGKIIMQVFTGYFAS